jgi:norsolorinic acid ketoreductase
MRPPALVDFAAAVVPSITAHSTSDVVPLALDEDTAAVSMATLAARLEELNIHHLDVVIANAGTSAGFRSIADTNPEDVMRDFVVNSIGPMKLFKACWPLIKTTTSTDRTQKKFVLVTSSVGSIASLEDESFPSTAYGMSKAAANWFAKKLSVEFKDEGLAVGIVHPG